MLKPSTKLAGVGSLAMMDESILRTTLVVIFNYQH
jgi:hypothetical protein